MSETIYKKVGNKYVPIAPYSWTGFPMDGIWIVKFRNGHESSASCVARLDNLPPPYPFYNMILDRNELTKFFVTLANEDKPFSWQEVADRLILFLAELHKPEILKIQFPNAPYTKLNVPDNTNLNEFL